MRRMLLTVPVALMACAVEPTVSKLDACADQQRRWCDLAGRADDVDCWNAYFDWCFPPPRLQRDNAAVPTELQDRCMTDLLDTVPDPLGHWLPDVTTVPASCRSVWSY